jgi:hypothetical protein
MVWVLYKRSWQLQLLLDILRLLLGSLRSSTELAHDPLVAILNSTAELGKSSVSRAGCTVLEVGGLLSGISAKFVDL